MDEVSVVRPHGVATRKTSIILSSVPTKQGLLKQSSKNSHYRLPSRIMQDFVNGKSRKYKEKRPEIFPGRFFMMYCHSNKLLVINKKFAKI